MSILQAFERALFGMTAEEAAEKRAQQIERAVSRALDRLVSALDDDDVWNMGDEQTAYLVRRQRERGLCSVRECDQPIAGWCATCDDVQGIKAYKLCREHLQAHCDAAPAGHEHTPYWLYADEGAEGAGNDK